MVGRALPSRRNSTTATTRLDSSSARPTLPSPTVMKSACRKITRSALTPAGIAPCSSPSAAVTAAVSLSVSAPGCFCTDRMTASPPSSPALPRAGFAATPTRATWRSRIGAFLRVAITVLARASISMPGASARITNSAAPWSTAPPPALTPTRASARSISATATSSPAIRAGSGAIRTWRVSPPITVTCETPAIAASRGRTVQSAMPRSAMASILRGATGRRIRR